MRHVKQFNKMFNDLNPLHFDKFTYLMAEAVVNKVKLANELTSKALVLFKTETIKTNFETFKRGSERKTV